jgi:hypothetical protein
MRMRLFSRSNPIVSSRAWWTVPQLRVAIVAIFFVLLPRLAHAQDEVCDEELSINWFIQGMDAIDAAFAAFDVEKARLIATDLKENVRCCVDPIHANHLVRHGRQRALAAFFDQDESLMAYWGQLDQLNPELPWPEGFEDPEHPLRDTLSFMDKGMPVELKGRGLDLPKGTVLLLDGRPLTKPIAVLDMPHMVQVLDRPGHVISGGWQDGTAFADYRITYEPTELVVPNWYDPPPTDLDPNAPVVIDPKELQIRKKLAYQAKLDAAEAAALMEKAQAAEAKRRVKRAEQTARREAKLAAKAGPVTETTAVAEVVKEYQAPTHWLHFQFKQEQSKLNSLDGLDVGSVGAVDCSELLRLEPRSLMGTLRPDQIQCLELRMRHEPKQTTRDSISRILMADAWAKQEMHRWEGAVRRHLTVIGRSDADLCYIFARYLARLGEGHYVESIRWSNRALENSLQWHGERRVDRIYSLRQLTTLAAQRQWHDAAAEVLADYNQKTKQKESFWRNQTKAFAREWLDFAKESGRDSTAAHDVCVSAAGTEDYCLANR